MKIRACLLVCALALPLLNVVEAKKPHNAKDKKSAVHKKEAPFAGAVRKYQQKSERYNKRADKAENKSVRSHLRSISKGYAALANHKRAAGEAQKKGQSYDWSEYRATKGEIRKLEQEIKAHKKAGYTPDKKNQGKTKPSLVKTSGKKDAEKHLREASGKPDQLKRKGDNKDKTYKTKDGFRIRTKL